VSKKRFTAGLESVFGSDQEETFDRGLLVDESEKPTAKTKRVTKKRKSSSRKNFTTDLDSLFDTAFSDEVDNKLELREEKTTTKPDLETKTKSVRKAKRTPRPLSGLDALIRQTIDSGTLNYDPNAKKRVTFTCEKENLDKLKQIARMEKSYLKDILGDIVASFIDEYESKKDRQN